MNPMQDALKRKMMELQAGQPHPSMPSENGDAEPGAGSPSDEKSDLAPALHGVGGMEIGAKENPAHLEDQHAQILAALADGGHGSKAGSLHQAVSNKASEKFAAIQAEKKKKM